MHVKVMHMLLLMMLMPKKKIYFARYLAGANVVLMLMPAAYGRYACDD